MHQPLHVRIVQGVGHSGNNFYALGKRKRRVLQARFKIRTVDELGHHKAWIRVATSNVKDWNNVGVIQCCGGARLMQKLLDALCI